jgi:hypothetical protein
MQEIDNNENQETKINFNLKKNTEIDFEDNKSHFANIPSLNALNNLISKNENPFKMPTRNEEIFEIRDVLRQEKESKKTANRNKSKKRNPSKENCVENLANLNQNNAKLYLTETNQKNVNAFMKKYNSVMNSLHNENKMQSINTQAGTKLLQNIEEEKQKELDKIREDDKNCLLQKKIETLGAKKKENVRDYVNKTRELVLMKYIINVKNESAKRLEEYDRNEIESIKDSIFSMEEAEKLFKQQFYTKYEEYLKNLIKQKEKEKQDLNSILEEKMLLDAEKSKLINKISKLEKEKKNYEECQEFMIRVKEKILEIPFRLKEEVSNVVPQYNEILTTLSEVHKDRIKNATKTFNKRTSNAIVLVANIQKEQHERIKGYLKGNQIFKEPNDLIDEIKKMENDNINLLEEFNKRNFTLNENSKELEKIIQENKKIYKYNVLDIEIKEKQLKELKERNRKLNEERRNLLSENRDVSNVDSDDHLKFTKLSTRNKIYKPQLFAKIVEVYYTIEWLDFNEESHDASKKIVKDEEKDKLHKLKAIEKSLDCLNEKYSKYKNDISKKAHLEQKEKELENERKIQKSKDLKKQQELDEIRKRRENEERNNRIYIIPKRKTMPRLPPKNSNETHSKSIKSDLKELGFDDYISF